MPKNQLERRRSIVKQKIVSEYSKFRKMDRHDPGNRTGFLAKDVKDIESFSDNSSDSSIDLDNYFPHFDPDNQGFYGVKHTATDEKKIDAIVNYMKYRMKNKPLDLRYGK